MTYQIDSRNKIFFDNNLNKKNNFEFLNNKNLFLNSYLIPNKKVPKFFLCKKKNKENNMKMKQNLNEIFYHINESETDADSDRNSIKSN